MSNFLHKAVIKSALQAKRNKFDLSCNHVSTTDFYQLQPIYIKEMIPNETVKVDLASEVRCSPMVQPMFGSVRQLFRAFFVPCRTIMYGFNDFITNTPTVSSGTTYNLIEHVTRVQLSVIYQYFITGSGITEPASSAQSADIHCTWNSTVYNLILTPRGRLALKLLMSLGYKPNFSTLGTSSTDQSLYVSAMPLLAFAKIWVDWFANPQYDTRSTIEKLFSVYTSELNSTTFGNIMNTVLDICYSADYFTQAWDNPVAPNSNNLEPQINITDNSVPNPSQQGSSSAKYMNKVTNSADIDNSSHLASSNNGTPVISSQASATADKKPGPLSQYMLNVLHSVTDFVTRHRIAGSRALDRYLAEFGIQLSSEKLSRSVYIGKSVGGFAIGDVMQTSPEQEDGYSQGTGVGNFSGKMRGMADGHFEYTTDEFGFLVVVSYVEPMNFYTDGRPRYLQHLDKFDFFNGDFDNLGVQAIRKDELIANGFKSAGVPSGYLANGVFGYAPRYCEYKFSLDNLTGDFLLSSKNQSLDGWLLRRKYDLDYAYLNSLPVVHNNAFCVANDRDYAEIWQDQTNNADHFFVHYFFKVDCFAPMKPYYDMYDYSNENGKDVRMSVNGLQVSD